MGFSQGRNSQTGLKLEENQFFRFKISKTKGTTKEFREAGAFQVAKGVLQQVLYQIDKEKSRIMIIKEIRDRESTQSRVSTALISHNHNISHKDNKIH